jgi:cation:H+ antiporter
MLPQIAWFAAGLAALVVGATFLVRGASRLSLALGLSPLVIGLTVVAFGTSAPELAVSVGAAAKGSADIAIGNVVGSNIFNVLFIVGISALVVPLVVDAQIVRQEVPIMIAASLGLVAAAWNGVIGFVDGAVFLAALAAYTAFLVLQARRQSTATRAEYDDEFGGTSRHAPAGAVAGAIARVIAGLALLVAGSRWLVDAAVHFAQAAGVSELVIGLTIVSAGTSLPEVATSLAAAIKGERDIAVGNVVGSNTFNVLGCLGLSALVSPAGLPVAPAVLNFDLWVMVAVALACLPVFLTGHTVARWEGLLFLAAYVAYVAYLILAATEHDALPKYSVAMTVFVAPLVAVTLAVAVYQEWRSRRPSG